MIGYQLVKGSCKSQEIAALQQSARCTVV